MIKKKALIFGISGQDGAYLSDLLIKKKYNVIGVTRNKSLQNLSRLVKLNVVKKVKIYQNNDLNNKFLKKIFSKNKNISEIYFLSGETSPVRSINYPVEAINTNVIGLIKILEFIKTSKIKFFYASSSEIFEKNNDNNIFDENSKLGPRHPYGISKAAGLWFVKFYRSYYSLFCCAGILFNHESPLRKNNFIFKKIINNLKILKKKPRKLKLGDTTIKRDIGWAPEYVVSFWKMLQANNAKDYVIGAGKNYSIDDFLKIATKNLNINTKMIIKNDKRFIRKNDLKSYKSNPKLIKKELNWQNTSNLKKIVSKLINNDLY